MSRIVVFANGVLTHPNRLKARLRPDDRIFCADGGTRHALALELSPEKIIGDLDSLPGQLITQMEAAGVAIHRHPADKDQTDLELTLQLAVAEEPEEILLVTALGGRLDQMLANILALTHPQYAPVRLSLAEGAQLATLLRAEQSLQIQGQPGDTLSLVPLTPEVTGVTLSGVGWPLENATLHLGSTWSISNQLAGSTAHLTIGQGMVLVIHLAHDYEEEN